MSALSARADISGTPDNATATAAMALLYDFIAQRLAAGTSGAGTATLAELLLARDSLQIAPAQMRNLWINSDFGINQRGLTSVADSAYCLDRTYSLTESGSLTVGQLSQPTDGIPYAMRLTQPDASPKRMGAAQVVEARNCLAYRGSSLVFVPKLRSSAGGTLRAALLAHTGTADSVTRDVINTWASTTYTPGNFFIASNLTVIAHGSVVATANAWTDVPVSSASAGGIVAPSGMNNLIMVFWTESAQAQNATLDASIMRGGLGTNAPIWTPPDAQEELARCQRYLPAFNGNTIGNTLLGTGNANNTTAALVDVQFPVTARVVPTGLAYSNVAHFTAGGSWGGAVASAVSLGGQVGLNSAQINLTVAGINQDAALLGYINNAAGQLLFNGCEL